MLRNIIFKYLYLSRDIVGIFEFLITMGHQGAPFVFSKGLPRLHLPRLELPKCPVSMAAVGKF